MVQKGGAGHATPEVSGGGLQIAGGPSDSAFTVDTGTGDVKQMRSSFYDDMMGTMDTRWAARVSTGTVADLGDVGNGWFRFTTGAVNTNEESMDWNDLCYFQNTLRPSFEIHLDPDSVAEVRIEAGLIEDSGGGVDDYVMIRLDTAVDGLWYLAADNGTGEATDAGAAAAAAPTGLKFEFTADDAVEWFISDDGGETWVLQGSVTTKIPTAMLQPYILVLTRVAAGAAKILDVDYVKIQQDRV